MTPRHQKFIDAIAYSPIHILATMRGKDQYEIEKDSNGKVSVTKLGVGAKQREGFEYEFTCTFMLDRSTHLAAAQKDNTHKFEDETRKLIDETDGVKLIQWANEDAAANTTARHFEKNKEAGTGEGTVTDEERLKDALVQIDKLATSLVKDSVVDKKTIADTIKKHHTVNGKASPNYNSIKELDVAISVFKSLKALAK